MRQLREKIPKYTQRVFVLNVCIGTELVLSCISERPGCATVLGPGKTGQRTKSAFQWVNHLMRNRMEWAKSTGHREGPFSEIVPMLRLQDEQIKSGPGLIGSSHWDCTNSIIAWHTHHLSDLTCNSASLPIILFHLSSLSFTIRGLKKHYPSLALFSPQCLGSNFHNI